MTPFKKIMFVIAAATLPTAAFATDPVAADLFFTQANGTPTIVNKRTGEKSYLTKAANGAAPVDCPERNFWLDGSTIVRCGDGEKFKLVPPDSASELPVGALMLAPVPGDGSQGTDDPGPSKTDSNGKKATP